MQSEAEFPPVCMATLAIVFFRVLSRGCPIRSRFKGLRALEDNDVIPHNRGQIVHLGSTGSNANLRVRSGAHLGWHKTLNYD